MGIRTVPGGVRPSASSVRRSIGPCQWRPRRRATSGPSTAHRVLPSTRWTTPIPTSGMISRPGATAYAPSTTASDGEHGERHEQPPDPAWRVGAQHDRTGQHGRRREAAWDRRAGVAQRDHHVGVPVLHREAVRRLPPQAVVRRGAHGRAGRRAVRSSRSPPPSGSRSDPAATAPAATAPRRAPGRGDAPRRRWRLRTARRVRRAG